MTTGRLQGHQRPDILGRLAAGCRQNQNGKAQPDEGHAQRHHDGRQVAQMDERAKRRVERYQARQCRDPQKRSVVEPGCRDAGDQADEGTDRQIKLIDAKDEHLRDGCR